ncbi:MAG: hypothetical protein ACUVRM_04805 [Bacillota bacterium]
MGQKIDFKEAGLVLLEEFTGAERDYMTRKPPEVSEKARQAAEVLFASTVQSYREALLGCAIARIVNPEIDIRSPYDKQQGPRAFSGRSLDEKVINPFLTERRIPCSRGPYLASFRKEYPFCAFNRGRSSR